MASKTELEAARKGAFVIVRGTEVEERKVTLQGGREATFLEQDATLIVPGKDFMSTVSVSARERDEVLSPGVYECELWRAVGLGGYGRPELQWRDVRFVPSGLTRADLFSVMGE